MMACNKLFMMHNIGINDFPLIDLMNGMKEMQYNTAQYFLRTNISYFALILLYSEEAWSTYDVSLKIEIWLFFSLKENDLQFERQRKWIPTEINANELAAML